VDKGALQFLQDNLGRAQIHTVGERPYSDRLLHGVNDPVAKAMNVTSLTALTAYLLEDLDAHGKEKPLIVHVASPTEVLVRSQLTGKFRQREQFVVAEVVDLLPELFLDTRVSAEKFQIMLRTAFKQSKDRDLLLKFSGNLVDSTEVKVQDDGITQEATVKTGAASRANVEIPKTVKLVPFRAFLEVEQVESEFIMRLEEGLTFRLVEADGGAWRMEAMERVKAYLEDALKTLDHVTVIS
jgi:hypothetical protein